MNRRVIVTCGGLAVAGLAAILRPLIVPAPPAAGPAPSAPAPFAASVSELGDVAARPGDGVARAGQAADRATPVASAGVTVYVVGAVRRAGVYTLGPSARVVAAIHAAGGLASDADPLAVDLARPARDGEEIVVPVTGSVDAARRVLARAASANDGASAGADGGASGLVGTAETVARPSLTDDPASAGAPAPKRHRHRRKRRRARHATPASAYDPASVPATTTEAAPAASATTAAEAAPAPLSVDINTAGADALATLPGIGDALAERIVRFRELSGPFARPEELLDVNGMTDKRYEAIAPYVTI